jgi:DNA repair ATPase RecN
MKKFIPIIVFIVLAISALIADAAQVNIVDENGRSRTISGEWMSDGNGQRVFVDTRSKKVYYFQQQQRQQQYQDQQQQGWYDSYGNYHQPNNNNYNPQYNNYEEPQQKRNWGSTFQNIANESGNYTNGNKPDAGTIISTLVSVLGGN